MIWYLLHCSQWMFTFLGSWAHYHPNSPASSGITVTTKPGYQDDHECKKYGVCVSYCRSQVICWSFPVVLNCLGFLPGFQHIGITSLCLLGRHQAWNCTQTSRIHCVWKCSPQRNSPAYSVMFSSWKVRICPRNQWHSNHKTFFFIKTS